MITPRTLIHIDDKYCIFDLVVVVGSHVLVKTITDTYEGNGSKVDCFVGSNNEIYIQTNINPIPLVEFKEGISSISRIRLLNAYPVLIRITSDRIKVFYMGPISTTEGPISTTEGPISTTES